MNPIIPLHGRGVFEPSLSESPEIYLFYDIILNLCVLYSTDSMMGLSSEAISCLAFMGVLLRHVHPFLCAPKYFVCE